MWERRRIFERAEKPTLLDYRTVKETYRKFPEKCIARIVHLLSYQLIENENEGRYNFEEDVCPKGLMNVHIIFFPEGEIYLKIAEQKLKFIFYDAKDRVHTKKIR